MNEIIMHYKDISDSQREEEINRWRPWTHDKSCTTEEARLRKIISGAYLRLSRLDDSNPEVNHSMEILEQAIKGGHGTWP